MEYSFFEGKKTKLIKKWQKIDFSSFFKLNTKNVATVFFSDLRASINVLGQLNALEGKSRSYEKEKTCWRDYKYLTKVYSSYGYSKEQITI